MFEKFCIARVCASISIPFVCIVRHALSSEHEHNSTDNRKNYYGIVVSDKVKTDYEGDFFFVSNFFSDRQYMEYQLSGPLISNINFKFPSQNRNSTNINSRKKGEQLMCDIHSSHVILLGTLSKNRHQVIWMRGGWRKTVVKNDTRFLRSMAIIVCFMSQIFVKFRILNFSECEIRIAEVKTWQLLQFDSSL